MAGAPAHRACRADGSVQSARPNILVIKVDQLRFPNVFPPGINNAGDFLKQFMPNLYQLWQHGVKSAGHYTAASACTPARGTIITGLYSQQSWLVNTITAPSGQQTSPQPWLNPAYPTYGKLLRRVGYQTPYIGKWHVSIPRQDRPGWRSTARRPHLARPHRLQPARDSWRREQLLYGPQRQHDMRLISMTETSHDKGRSGWSSTGPAGRRPGA